MPHYHEGNRPWKKRITSEAARTFVPKYMKPGSVIIARDGAVYERQANGSIRRLDYGVTFGKDGKPQKAHKTDKKEI